MSIWWCCVGLLLSALLQGKWIWTCFTVVFDVVFKMYQEQIWPILERNNESKEAKNRANASPDTADFESASSALSTLK